MRFLQPLTAALLLLFQSPLLAQNVGIGTASPLKKFSVSGTVVVDHDYANRGTLDSAALLFGGQSAKVGLSSNKSGSGANQNGLDVWTAGTKRLSVSSEGNVGIGTDTPVYKLEVKGWMATDMFTAKSSANFATDAFIGSDLYVGETATVDERLSINGSAYGGGTFRLTVNNGNSFFGGQTIFNDHVSANGAMNVQGNVTSHGYVYGMTGVYASRLDSYGDAEIDGNTAIGGEPDPAYRLRVYDGAARIGGDFHTTGKAAIGGLVDNNYNLRVYGGPSRFGGDVEVNGNLNVNQINGTGTVRSNGPSPLRIGFDTEVIGALNLAVNQVVDRTISITDFDGGADGVRVSISQFVPDPLPAYANWQYLTMYIHSVDPLTNTAKLRITNTSSAPQSIKGTLYLLTVAKN